MQARLTITSPNGEIFQKMIGNTAIIGRGGSVHVRLNGDPQVSRYHAMLRCHNGFQYQVVDLGSRNGTFAGQTRVLLPAALSDEAYLHVGDHEIFLQALPSESAEQGMTLDPSACLDVVLLVLGLRDVETHLQSMTPDAFSQVLGTWHRNMFAYLGNCGAKPDKFVKGNLIGYWHGEPLASLLPQALATAWACVQYGGEREWQPGAPLEVSCALHTGRVALGMTGGKEAGEPLIGGAVNAVLKLHEASGREAADVVLSEAAGALLPEGDAAALQPLGYADVGGKAFSMRMLAAPLPTSPS